MNLVVDDYLIKFRKEVDLSKLTDHGATLRSQTRLDPEHYVISWAEHVQGISHGCLETGFFKGALHIDSVGLYQHCSLNLPEAVRAISEFEAPVPWQRLPLESKFAQPVKPLDWDGVVVVAQYPNDRSILRVGPPKKYFEFLEAVCAYHGRRAFIKVHPVIIGDRAMLFDLESIAAKYGCEMGHVHVSVIDKAEAVLTYNSTFAVDAIMRGKHVVQHAPGYFWQTGAVQFTHGMMRYDYMPIEREYADRFINFLLWKYCWSERMAPSEIVEVMRAYSQNQELFPLPLDLSYGGFLSR